MIDSSIFEAFVLPLPYVQTSTIWFDSLGNSQYYRVRQGKYYTCAAGHAATRGVMSPVGKCMCYDFKKARRQVAEEMEGGHAFARDLAYCETPRTFTERSDHVCKSRLMN